jgi:hypothetical protein
MPGLEDIDYIVNFEVGQGTVEIQFDRPLGKYTNTSLINMLRVIEEELLEELGIEHSVGEEILLYTVPEEFDESRYLSDKIIIYF